MLDVTHPPLWLVALIVAGAAPWVAGALQAVLESRLRRRTDAVLARALAMLPAASGGGASAGGSANDARAEAVESETRRGSG